MWKSEGNGIQLLLTKLRCEVFFVANISLASVNASIAYVDIYRYPCIYYV